MRCSVRGIVFGLITAAAVVLSGCAGTEGMGTEPHDPYESFNRSMFAFNKALDENLFEPIADGYVAVTPEPAREAVFNFFDNLGTLNTIVNQILQGKIERGMGDAGRFVINSTFGLAGLVDFASGIGVERHEEDFDQTFAIWGLRSGPYLELPLFGPSTVRALPAIPLDTATDPVTYVSTPYNIAVSAVDRVDQRARLSSAIELRDTSSLDPYVFQREAYLQRRRHQIYDGNPPLDPDLLTQ